MSYYCRCSIKVTAEIVISSQDFLTLMYQYDTYCPVRGTRDVPGEKVAESPWAEMVT